jgi:chromate transporter
MLLLELFTTFLLIGFVSFGGGYAMIPLIQEEVVNRHAWMTTQEFSDVIAVAGMSPGPIATNSAIFIGYGEAGVIGAMVAAAGMVIPSLLIILVVGMVFYKVQKSKLVKSAFYGLRPIITGLIMYAAFIFAVNNELISSLSWHSLSLIGIYLASLAALIYFRIHPAYVILLSGLVGIAVYA